MTPVSATPKPERVKCTHECKAGCSIYASKPDSCTAFMCLWLASQLFEDNMPDKWRPDRVGAVVDVNPHGTMTAHLKHEVAYEREGPLRDMLLYLANNPTMLTNDLFVVLDRPSGSHRLFAANGTTQELVACGVGPTGLKQFRTKFPGEA